MPDLVETIYDAAFDPGLWHDVIKGLVRRTGARNGIFYDHSNLTRQARILGAEGFDPHYLTAYERYYGALDPWHRHGATRPVGEVAQTASMLSDADLRRTEFYQDHLRPQGLFYAMGGPVVRTREHMAVFGIQGGYENGVFSPEIEAMVRSVMPHLRRAHRMQEKLAATRQSGAGLEAALHLLEQPVLVVDSDARLCFVNAAGERLLRDADLLRLSAGRLRAAHRGDDALFAKALSPVPRSGDGDATVMLRRASGAAPAAARIMPLRRSNGAGWSGRIAVFVDLPPPRRDSATLAAAFALSAAEARLWTGLCAGRRLSEIAEASAVSVNTVRVQLRALFAKTGTHRQADLVRLALELRNASGESGAA